MPNPLPYPPCCVILVRADSGESLAQATPSRDWTHIHALARQGISGVLLLRNPTQDTSPVYETLVSQFLGVKAGNADIAARYKGLRPVCLTDSASIAGVATASGCLTERLAAGKTPRDAAVATRQHLAAGAPAVFLAVADPARASPAPGPDGAGCAALAWVQAFLGSGCPKGTLLTLVFVVEAPLPGPLARCIAEAAGPRPVLAPAGPDFPPLPRPWQSFQASGLTGLAEVSGACAGLTLQHLPGVTRCDLMDSFQPASISQRGGAGMILAESLLAELAFKTGHAPKYGA